MIVEAIHRYPCEVTELLPLFCKADALQQRNERLGFRELEIRRCTFDGRQGEVELLRSVPTAATPPRALRKFQQDWNRISQRESWQLDDQGFGHCRYSIRIPGLPVALDGVMKLEPQMDGCVNRVELEIRCSVPIIGKMAVSYLAEDSAVKLDQEYRVLLDLIRTL